MRHFHKRHDLAGRRGSHGNHPGFGGRFGMHARGRRRVFDGGELRLVLLKLIDEEPRHGYDLIREIEERTGGAYAPSPGVVYPTVTLLGDMDLIAERRSDGAKKVYAITQAGTAHLTEHQEEVDALMARLVALGEHARRTNGGPVRRAMGNLRTVLQSQLSGEEIGDGTLHEVAAIIDEAAQRIERLS